MIGVIQRRRLSPALALATSAAIAASVWMMWPGRGPGGFSPLAFQVTNGGQLDLSRTEKVDRSGAQIYPAMPEPYFGKAEYAPGVVLVTFKPRVNEQSKAALIEGMGLIHDRAHSNQYFARLKVANPIILQVYGNEDGICAALRRSPIIRTAELDMAIKPDQTLPNDPMFGQLWGLHNTGQSGGTPDADVDAPEAWDAAGTYPRLVVAVADDGCDWNHPDLLNNIYTNPDEIPGNNIDDDNNGYIDDVHGWDFVSNDNNVTPGAGYEHGTHVCGTVGAVINNNIGICGINPRSYVMPLLMYAGQGSWMSDLARSIDYAWQNGATVISVSYNIDGYTQVLVDAIVRAGNADVVYCNSAGNNGQQNPPRQAIRNVAPNSIFVAATDRNDQLASFSNYGTLVEIGAPGVAITSTTPGNTYQTWDGTSMATPHVAGAVAVVRALFPNLTARQALDRVIGTADIVPALVGKVAGGRLNLNNSIDQDSTPPSDPLKMSLQRYNSSNAQVLFISSGDDGTVGRASKYDFRVSASPITVGNFNSAIPVIVQVPPTDALRKVIATIPNLPPASNLYCAVRAQDNVGNVSAGIATCRIKTTVVPVIEDAEGAPKFSAVSGPWAITTEDKNSGLKSWTDSPGGNYANSIDISMVSNQSYAVTGPFMYRFAAKIDLESNYDYLYADYSVDNGFTWNTLGRLTGTAAWKGYGYLVPAVNGQSVKFRFRMTTDSSVVRNGVYIDDIYMVQASQLYFDNMETNTNWTGAGGFAWVTDRAFSPTHSWTDSPGGNYTNNFSTTLTQNAAQPGSGDMALVFKAYLNSEANYDYLRVRVATDGGGFTEKAAYSGQVNAWTTYSVSLGSPSTYRVQFQFTTDSSVVYDGVWIDDVSVVSEPWVDASRFR